MEINVGEKCVMKSLPMHTNFFKLGQIVTVTKLFEQNGHDFVVVDNMDRIAFFSHRLRPLTPLDEALS